MSDDQLKKIIEAEILAKQAQEWMRTCKMPNRCPMAQIYEYLIVLHEEIKKLKLENKLMREYPDES